MQQHKNPNRKQQRRQNAHLPDGDQQDETEKRNTDKASRKHDLILTDD